MTTDQLRQQLIELEAIIDRINEYPASNHYATGVMAEDAQALRRELGLRRNCHRCNSPKLRINQYGNQFCVNCGTLQ